MDKKYNDELRTHRRLRKAYTVLLTRKRYDSISVKELTEYAEMSRAAFYLHFESIEEFSYQCSQYLIEKMTSQMIYWLDCGREALGKTCKKRNLILDESDLELFAQYVRQEIYFPGKSSFDTVLPIYAEFMYKRFGTEKEQFFFDKRLRFFIRAFSVTVMDSFVEYDSKKMMREMTYVFTIWDKLFPAYKL